MSDTQCAMGAVARAHRFLDALKGDDPEHIITWGEARATMEQLLGDLAYEERQHQETRDLLRLVDSGSERPVMMEKALRALCVAVEYTGRQDIGALPGAAPDCGMGYEARVPEQFIIDAHAALDHRPPEAASDE